jgi:hypothetical protein
MDRVVLCYTKIGDQIMKKICYGDCTFSYLMSSGRYFVDKTMYIHELENLDAQCLVFLRPRRFGKTLFLTMLENYYDINCADSFDELFDGLYIAEHPTPLRNSYRMLRMDFSKVCIDGDFDSIKKSFNLHVRDSIKDYFVRYQEAFRDDHVKADFFESEEQASDLFSKFNRLLSAKGLSCYMLIDNYDRFANNVLFGHGLETYKNIALDTGFLRDFFKVAKSGVSSKAVAKMYVTGVTPLVWTDATDGLELGENISLVSTFNEMVGLTQEETESAVNYYVKQGAIPPEERMRTLKAMKQSFNGYLFSPYARQSIYNISGVLHLLRQFTKLKKMPEMIFDEEMLKDCEKLQQLILKKQKTDGNVETLSKILQDHKISSVLDLSLSATNDIKDERFVSFLYYLGFLTLHEIENAEFVFAVPNDMCEGILLRQLRKSFTKVYK